MATIQTPSIQAKNSAPQLKIGSNIFSNNIIQGPLAGISSAPFRKLIWRYSQPAFCYTEMISCKTLIHQSESTFQRFIKKDPEEGPVCFQLSGTHPHELGEAVKIATNYGANLIDLNCGCPVKKIRSKGAGSKLLSDATKLYKLILAMKLNTHLPISIKIRVDGQSNDRFNQEIVKVVAEAGADFLVVHGRHWTEHYETPCQHDQIQFFAESLNIPVIGNGDISCVHSLKKIFNIGCAGAMIGRAGVGQPWLIQKLTSELSEKNFILPSSQEICTIFLEHITDLATLLRSEKFALLQARKFSKYYARHLENKMAFCDAVNSSMDIQSLALKLADNLAKKFYD